MSETSRRGFIAVAGAGAAAGTVGLTAGAAAASGATIPPGRLSGPVVVYIEQTDGDRLTIMAGDDEVEVTDRELVTRIVLAAGGQ